MKKQEVIDGLQDLIYDRLSFVDRADKFYEGDKDSPFVEDIKVLKEAIRIIKESK